MAYLADLAVLDVWSMDYFTAERCTNTLMAEADAQYRNITFFDKPRVEPEVRLSKWVSGTGG